MDLVSTWELWQRWPLKHKTMCIQLLCMCSVLNYFINRCGAEVGTHSCHSGCRARAVAAAGGCSCITVVGWNPAGYLVSPPLTLSASWPFQMKPSLSLTMFTARERLKQFIHTNLEINPPFFLSWCSHFFYIIFVICSIKEGWDFFFQRNESYAGTVSFVMRLKSVKQG